MSSNLSPAGTQTWLRPVSSTQSANSVEQQQQPQQQQSQQPQQQQPQQQQPQQQQPQQQHQHQSQMYETEGGNMDTLSFIIHSLNSNPYLVGVFMLLLNLGGRFLSMELTPKQEQFLQQRWLRPLLFFIVIFVATRNLAVAFWITLFLFVILWILANEKSPFCLVPGWREFENTNTRHAQYEQNMETIMELNTHSAIHH